MPNSAGSDGDTAAGGAGDRDKMYWDRLDNVVMQDNVADLEGSAPRGSQSADRNAEHCEALIIMVRTPVQITTSNLHSLDSEKSDHGQHYDAKHESEM